MKPRKLEKTVMLVLLLLFVLTTVDSALLTTKAPLAKRTLCYQGISASIYIISLLFSMPLPSPCHIQSSFSLLHVSLNWWLCYILCSTIVTGSDSYQSTVKSCSLLDPTYTGVWMCSKIQVCSFCFADFWVLFLVFDTVWIIDCHYYIWSFSPLPYFSHLHSFTCIKVCERGIQVLNLQGGRACMKSYGCAKTEECTNPGR